VPQNITEDQVHKAYELGKSVHEESTSLSDAATDLAETLSMNRGSAQGYIYTLGCLLSGKEYRRTINAYATDYYLTRIYQDFGRAALTRALSAVQKHLEYYEGVGKSKQPKIHDLVVVHLENLQQSMTQKEYDEEFARQITTSLNEPRKDRLTRLKAANKKPSTITVLTEAYRRNPDVVAEVLFRADGKCERCTSAAPFLRTKDRTPYLEVHHIIQLAKGGEDTVENAIALCPNCHRELHFGQ